MPNTQNFKYEEFLESLEIIQNQIKDQDLIFDKIIGLNRGGNVLATYLSHRLRIPCYISNLDEKEIFLSSNENILIVDEISDTGDTLLEMISNLKDITFKVATIHYRYSTKYIPDFYYQRINNDDWIIYPWEL